MRSISNFFSLLADLKNKVRGSDLDPTLVHLLVKHSLRHLPPAPTAKQEDLTLETLNRRLLNVSMMGSSLKRLGVHGDPETLIMTQWMGALIRDAETPAERVAMLSNIYGYLWYITSAKPSAEST